MAASIFLRTLTRLGKSGYLHTYVYGVLPIERYGESGYDEYCSNSQASNGRCPGLCWLFFALWFGAVVISTPEPNTAHESFYRAGEAQSGHSRARQTDRQTDRPRRLSVYFGARKRNKEEETETETETESYPRSFTKTTSHSRLLRVGVILG